MRHKVITCTLLVLLLVCLLGNCYQLVLYHRLLGTINNLKVSLNITNDRITELENKQVNNKPLVKIYSSPVQTKSFSDYQKPQIYIPENTHYFELQQHKDRMDSLQQQTDEINKKLRDKEITEDAERFAKPVFMF